MFHTNENYRSKTPWGLLKLIAVTFRYGNKISIVNVTHAIYLYRLDVGSLGSGKKLLYFCV